MITSKLRSGTARFLKESIQRRHRVVTPTSSAFRFISTEHEKECQELGLLDEDGLTVFDTLHEMQVNSCKVFSENDLFGTYQEDSNSFEYITYQDYADKVD